MSFAAYLGCVQFHWLACTHQLMSRSVEHVFWRVQWG